MVETKLPKLPNHHAFTPEFQLLAACSWIAPQSLIQSQSDQITTLCKEDMDWNLFVELVHHHRTHVLSYSNLSRHARNYVPENIWQQLKAMNDQTRIRALQHAAELARLCKKFTELDIVALPLKGVLLSQELYGDPGIRQSKDLDILIKPKDLDKTATMLEEEGYRPALLSHNILTARHKEHIRNALHHLEYFHESKHINLEIHWNCVFWQPAQVAELWNHCRQIEWLGVNMNCLDDEARLLYLCDHGTSHQWFRLKWLGDIAMLFSRGPSYDWSKLPGLADRLGLRRVLAQTALLVHWIYGIQLPDPINEIMNETPISLSLGNQAIRAMQLGAGTLNRPLEGLRIFWFLMKLKPCLKYTDIMKAVMIAPGDLCYFPIPDRLFWLYIPLRPVFWCWRHSMNILNKGKS